MTRVARGKISLRRSRLDLVAVVRRSGEDLRSVLSSRGLELVMELPGEALWVEGDETRLAQVVGTRARSRRAEAG